MIEKKIYICEVCSESHENFDYMHSHEQLCKEYFQKRKDSGQLNISEILEKCKDFPNVPVVITSSSQENCEFVGMSPDCCSSYRGYYEELCIEPSTDKMILKDFVKLIDDAIGSTFSGYHGGEYTMHTKTFVWVSEYGTSSSFGVVDCVLTSDDIVHLVIKYIV